MVGVVLAGKAIRLLLLTFTVLLLVVALLLLFCEILLDGDLSQQLDEFLQGGVYAH